MRHEVRLHREEPQYLAPPVVALQRLPGREMIWLCKALDVSRSGFHGWMNRTPAKRTVENEVL